MQKILGKIHFILIFTLILFCENAKGEVATIKPDQPTWGETLTIIYNPEAKGAKFSSPDEVHVVGFLFFSDHSSKKSWAKMDKVGNLFQYLFPIPEKLAYVTFYFITLNDWDSETMVSSKIYRSDGLPARGAYMYEMLSPYLSSDYKQLISKEIALYPDNYTIYRHKWFIASALDPDKLSSMVREDVEKLTQQVKDEPSELLSALSYGYLLLEDEGKGREILKKMIDRYPTSPLTSIALESYEYQIFAQQIKGEGPDEIEQLKQKLIERYPNTELARNNSQALATEKEFPLATVENICHRWMEEEPDNPMAYYILALAYNAHQHKIDDASIFIEKAINLMLQGKLRFYEDISGKHTELLLPSAHLLSAEIFLKQHNPAKALSAVKTAQALEKQTSHRAYTLEGQVWEELSNSSNAEAAYLEAWKRGSNEAESLLQTLYEKKHGNLEGFEKYLNERKKELTTSKADKKPAPSFRVTSLEGEHFELDNLRGKVIVLNFWSTGCAPCKVEIPALNQLVQEFKDKEVVFLAFAPEGEKTLRKFLRKRDFAYHIISNSGKIAKHYGVSALPVHIIIDKKGRIDSRLFGGTEKSHEDLRPLILNALDQP